MPPNSYIAYSSDLQLSIRASSFTPESGFAPYCRLHCMLALVCEHGTVMRLQLTGTEYSDESGTTVKSEAWDKELACTSDLKQHWMWSQ